MKFPLLLALLAVAGTLAAHAAEGVPGILNYQGRLAAAGTNFDGTAQFKFALVNGDSSVTYWSHDGTSTAGSEPAGAVSLPVRQGLFAVNLGDTTLANMTVPVPVEVFAHSDVRLRLWVSDGVSGFTQLAPDQRVAAVGYAMMAANVPAGAIQSGQLAAGAVNTPQIADQAVTADKIADGTLTAADLSLALASNTFWRLDGNAGTTPGTHFLGTADNQPLEFKVNGLRALRLEDNGDSNDFDPTPDGAPNVVAGSPVNFVGLGVVGATISGGGATNYAFITRTNAVLGNYGTVGGGLGNRVGAASLAGAIGGGFENTVGTNASYSAMGGGYINKIADSSASATIAGGSSNDIGTNSGGSAIGGGYNNNIAANAAYATIPGGINNAAANYALAAGRRAKALHEGTFVWADSVNADFASTASRQFLIRAGGGVGINKNNPISTLDVNGTVNATVFLGNGNGLTGVNADTLDGLSPAGFWQLGGNAGTIPGTHFLGTTDNQPLEFRVGNRTVLRLESEESGTRIIGGRNNTVDAASTNSAVLSGRGNAIAGAAHESVIVGGVDNRIGSDQESAFIGGGDRNVIELGNEHAVIVGGRDNLIGTNCLVTAIVSGERNRILRNVDGGLIVGGIRNDIHGWQPDAGLRTVAPVIVGGSDNEIGRNSSWAVIVGGDGNRIGSNSFYAIIVGGGGSGVGTYNLIGDNAEYATVVGGKDNIIHSDSPRGFIGGGYGHKIRSSYASIVGGSGSSIGTNSPYSAIGGGSDNAIGDNSEDSTIGGGRSNTIGDNSTYITIGGGDQNKVGTNSSSSVIGGGFRNDVTNNAAYATIPGGRSNTATNYAFAAGRRAKARHLGSFVWADATDLDVASTANNQFTVRASGGVRIFSDSTCSSGVKLLNGETSWSATSDRNVKKHRSPVDERAVLEKLAAVPVERWRYQWETDDSPPHLGPMAQDFKQAFYPGRDDTGISTLEFDGVALAAIQGLNRKVEDRSQRSEVRSQELEARSREIEAKNVALEKEVAELKALVQTLAAKVNGGGQ